MKWIREHIFLTSVLSLAAVFAVSTLGYYLLNERENEEEEKAKEEGRTFLKKAV